MKKAIVVGILVVVACLGQVQVSRSKSEMDGLQKTLFRVPSATVYRNVVGMVVRPDLLVACNQKSDSTQFVLILESGPLQTVDEETGLRMKLDGREPSLTSWGERSSHKSYQYFSWFDENGMIPDTMDGIDAAEYRNTLKAIRDIGDAKTMLIEVRPFMTGSVVVLRFDVSGLRRAMDRYPECRIDTQLAKGASR